MAKQNPDDQFSDAEAKRRFEAAVDAALRTAPMHKTAEKKPAKKKAKPKAKKA